MISIPKQLQEESFRFILLGEKSKVPIEKEWQKTNNYPYNSEILLSHLEKNHNYGIVGGNNLIIVDADSDELQKHVSEKLPKTFAVKTGRDGVHNYYYCPFAQKIVLQIGEKHYGEVQSTGSYVVAPNSIHPNGNAYAILSDLPISTITEDELKTALAIFIEKTDIDPKIKVLKQTQNLNSKLNIKITDLCDTSSFKTYANNQLRGTNPWHGSTTCSNFYVDTLNNQWHCFRCNSGGGVAEFIAVKEGIIKCDECKEGSLKGQRFISLIKILEEKYGYETDVFVPQYLLSHLKDCEFLDRMTKLHGEEYKILIKALWYHTHSFLTQTHTLEVGDIQTDLRFHLGVALGTGRGKKNVVDTVRLAANALNLEFVSPVSYHPEALVGKTLRKKNKSKEGSETYSYDQFPGHLASDVVVLNESIELFRSTELTYSESRKYLNVACDNYPTNEIMKRNVDIDKNFALRYSPHCCVSVLYQPFPIEEEAILVGFLRRLNNIFINNLEYAEDSAYESRVFGSSKISFIEAAQAYIAHLKDVKESLKDDLELTEGTKRRFVELHKCLLTLASQHSTKANNYEKHISFALQDSLLKMSALQAISRKRSIVDIIDVELAFVDLCEITWSTFDYIRDVVSGYFDYGLQTRRREEVEFLTWLFELEAISKESSNVDTKEAQDVLSNSMGVTPDRARKIIASMKKRGLVDSTSTTRTDVKKNVVWLTQSTISTLKKRTEKLKYDDSCAKEYNKICNKINEVFSDNSYNGHSDYTGPLDNTHGSMSNTNDKNSLTVGKVTSITRIAERCSNCGSEKVSERDAQSYRVCYKCGKRHKEENQTEKAIVDSSEKQTSDDSLARWLE